MKTIKKSTILVVAGMGLTLGSFITGNSSITQAAEQNSNAKVANNVSIDVPFLAGNILNTSKDATFIGPSNATLVVNGQNYTSNTDGVFHIQLPNYLEQGDNVITKFISSAGVSSATKVYTVANGNTIDPVVIAGANMLFGSVRPNSMVTLLVNGQESGSAFSFGYGQWYIEPLSHISLGSSVMLRVTSRDYSQVLFSPVYNVKPPTTTLPKGPELVQEVTDRSTDILFTATPYAKLTLLGKNYYADSAGIIHIKLDTLLKAGTTLTATMVDDYSNVREPLTFTVIASR
ncbi:hypothetical protein HB852_13595 [Listeria grandensis]|uniref:Bacterial Ig domain-containing protein n=1 Tax=Listeria grandensis TaxID=1494963 RepID=A0A7X0Y5M8_9LIST|nr:hypothetical protein [Listeria grandensis]MBC1475649.1 hypothetical protein [Listeria grandensis]MBC1937425.1 hypothetical protein [Listeria grandensis]